MCVLYDYVHIVSVYANITNVCFLMLIIMQSCILLEDMVQPAILWDLLGSIMGYIINNMIFGCV